MLSFWRLLRWTWGYAPGNSVLVTGQAPDEFPMRGKLPQERLPVGQLELRKIETGSYRAADQREIPLTGNLRAEPAPRRDNGLKGCTGSEIGPQLQRPILSFAG
jgi:hypothetical protein